MLDNYYTDPFGVVHQRCIKPFYKDYAAQYNDYGELSTYMAYLRYGYIRGAIGNFDTILDVGYGNGAFLNVCTQAGHDAYGYDVSDYPVPNMCTKINVFPAANKYNVITMFDSLEHFKDINFIINGLECDYLVISVPNCEFPQNDKWFENWKHRRPNEHFHHFNKNSLLNFMKYNNNWGLVSTSYIEDVIRKSEFASRNILTAIFGRI